jgi:hypothetical protein
VANRKSIVIAGVTLLFAVVNRLPAQNNAAEIYGGYVYTKANPESTLPKTNMHGWVGSVTGYAFSWFGVGGEVSAVFGDIAPPTGVSGAGLHAKEYSYLFGPQFRFVDQEKVQSSFKFLLGGVFGQVRLPSDITSDVAQRFGSAGYSAFDQTKFAMLMAVPVDISVSRLLAIRVEPGLYVTGFNKEKQSNFRFSMGPVFRFGKR